MRRILKKVVALFTILLLLIGSTLPAMAVEESESQELYRLTVESEHGTLEIYDGTGKQLVEADSIIKVVEGEKLSIIARPDKGYQLKNLVINGEELEVNEEKAEYIMPDQDVIIHVEFSEEEKQKEEVTEEIELEENEKEKIFFTEDTDYSQIQRKPYGEIDWSMYGGGGITDPSTKKVLEEKGINVFDENYGAKLEKRFSEEIKLYKNRSLEEQWAVGSVHTGHCEITNAWFVPEEGQSYFELGNFSGELSGAEMIGYGWCADHTAAEPPAGHPVIQVDGTVTSVDFNSGIVELNLLVTPDGVTDGSSNENGLIGYQHIGAKARMRVDFGGYLELQKKSANPELTLNNSCYSLEGAEYGVFQEEKQVTTLRTDANGYAKSEKLPSGDYTIKELTPPKGFALDMQSYNVKITSNVTTLEVTDYPQSDPVTILLGKIDKETNANKPQGSASLEGAEFTFKYYTVQTNKDPATMGLKPTRQWVMRTDERGFTRLSEKYKVPNVPQDEFYKLNGVVTLPLGTITIQETKAPKGYAINPEIFVRQIKLNETADGVETYNVPTIPETIIHGGVLIEKWDSELNKKEPQGGASLKGTKLDLISENANAVVVKGKTYQKGEVITTLTTDQDGKAQTEKDLLPFGTYKIKEKTPPTGYQNAGTIERTFKVEKDQTLVKLNTADTAIKNEVIRGGVEIEKWDNELNRKEAQGGATLEGAVFEISSLNDHPVKVEGKLYKKGEVVKTLTTDKSGKVSTTKDLLPYGKYQAKEVKAPEGYNPTGEIKRTFSIQEHGKIVKLNTTDTAIKNDVIRGDLQLVKFKESSDEDEDQKTPLEGIIFEITSKTTKKTVEIVTDKHGYASTTQLNVSKRGNLAYDTYIVHEKNPPEGTKPVKDFQVTIQNEGETLYYILEDKLIVSPVRLAKLDAETGKIIPLANAEFQLLDKNKKPIEMTTHYPTEEVHKTFKTDESGTFTLPEKLPAGTYYFKEIHAPEGYLLNGQEIRFEIKEGHDWAEPILVQVKDLPAKGQIRIRKSDETNGEVLEGASFEIKAKKDIVTPDGTIRVKKGEVVDTITTEKDGTATSKKLYLGSYQVKEVCQPEGYVLTDKTWDVELKYKDESTELVYETLEITNVLTKVVIEKTVKDSDEKLSGVQFAFWNKQMTDGLDDGIAAKETVKTNKNGQAVIEGLKPDMTYCIQEMEGIDGYAIDDQIFEVKVDPDGKIEGKDSITLTVENAKTEITETNAISADTNTQQGLPKKEAVIQDKVCVKNLQKGETYLLKGVLMDAETQLPLQISGKEITLEKTFTAEKDSMEVSMEIHFDASACAGKTIVVYERLFLGEKEISVHTDLNDKKQTVTFPKHEIGTKATDQDTGTQEAVPKKEATILDKVSYQNLIVGQEYTVKGVLMSKQTGKPLLVNGKEIRAEKKFCPEKPDGNVEIAFTFDASSLSGESVVVYEHLYVQGIEIAVHTDLNDERQTITFPKHEIGTKATDQDSGKQEGIVQKKSTIIDTVSYKNLIVGQEYTVKGVLMSKQTRKPLLINGKEIRAEKKFRPEKPDGSVEVSFTFDSSALKNQEVVVFEHLYVQETEVATHTDLNDKGQTVKYKLGTLKPSMPGNRPSGGVKTGDQTSILLAVLLLAVASITIVVVFAFRKNIRKGDREKKNGEEIGK